MKKLTFITLLIFAITCFMGLVGCSNDNEDILNPDGGSLTPPQKITVTFIQEGYENKEFTVYYGQSFTNIPSVNAKKGYTVAWETVDLSELKADVEVHAIETPNVYTIYYQLNSSIASIENDTKRVTFDANYTLDIPTRLGYKFLGWKIKDNNDLFPQTGIYAIDEDLTLVAEWQLDEQSSGGWLPPV